VIRWTTPVYRKKFFYQIEQVGTCKLYRVIVYTFFSMGHKISPWWRWWMQHRNMSEKYNKCMWWLNIGMIKKHPFWVISRRLSFTCRRFGTHCSIFIGRYLPMKMEQSVPKRRHLKFRRRGITQKKAYSIQNSAKVWNQEWKKNITLYPLTWKIRWAPINASRWQMGFNSAFEGLTKK